MPDTYADFPPPGGSITLLDVYPVGSIYLSMLATDPGTIFGGTWARIAQGRGLWGQDGGDTDFDVAGDVGGAKTHALVVGEIPAHAHGVTDPQHTHVQNQHLHAVTDPNHNHVQNQHLHAITDPGHTHGGRAINSGTAGTAGHQGASANNNANTTTSATQSATTGITNQNTTPTNVAAATGVTIQNTTPTNQNAATGVTTQNQGGGGAHNNMPPWFTVYAWQRTA